MSIMLGIRYLMEDAFEEAAYEFKKSLRQNPRSAPAHYFLGVAYVHMGRLNQADQMFRRASAIDPSYVEAEAGRIASLVARGRHEEALSHFREDLGRWEIPWREEHGEALFRKVAEDLEKSLHKAPNPPLYNSLGILYVIIGQEDRAQTLWKRSLAADPDQPFLCELIADRRT